MCAGGYRSGEIGHTASGAGGVGRFALTFLVTSGAPGLWNPAPSSFSEASIQSQPCHGDVRGGGTGSTRSIFVLFLESGVIAFSPPQPARAWEVSSE